MWSPLFWHKLKWFKNSLFINWLIIFKQSIFNWPKIQTFELNFTFLKIQDNSEMLKLLLTNKQKSGASETFWIKWMYRLAVISCPQYTQWPASVWGCTLNNWTACPFFEFMGFVEKTYILIFTLNISGKHTEMKGGKCWVWEDKVWTNNETRQRKWMICC